MGSVHKLLNINYKHAWRASFNCKRVKLLKEVGSLYTIKVTRWSRGKKASRKRVLQSCSDRAILPMPRSGRALNQIKNPSLSVSIYKNVRQCLKPTFHTE